MAIVKRGDNKPIESFYDTDGDEAKCPRCGSKLIVIAMDDQDNKLVCTHCEDEDEQ